MTGESFLAAETAPAILAWIAVALRFFARRRGGSRCWWDDHFMFMASVLIAPLLALAIYGEHVGIGTESNNGRLEEAGKIVYAFQIIHPWAITAVRLSLLSLYLRLFGIRQSLTMICYYQAVFVTMFLIAAMFLSAFQCTPASAAWTMGSDESHGECESRPALLASINAINVILDFMILITPIQSVWGLNLDKKKKVIIVGVLILGGGIAVFALGRLIVFLSVQSIGPSVDHANDLIWSSIEVHAGIICGCIPVLAPLLPKSWINGSSTVDLFMIPSDAFKQGNKTEISAFVGDDERQLVMAQGSSMGIHTTVKFTVQEDSERSEPENKSSISSKPEHAPRRLSV